MRRIQLLNRQIRNRLTHRLAHTLGWQGQILESLNEKQRNLDFGF